jgi:hypothetical protein
MSADHADFTMDGLRAAAAAATTPNEAGHTKEDPRLHLPFPRRQRVNRIPYNRKPPAPRPRAAYAPPRLVTRPERTYSLRRKREVLLYLVHGRVVVDRATFPAWSQWPPQQPGRPLAGRPDGSDLPEGVRRPSLAEAARRFRVASGSTVAGWWSRREKIFGGPVPGLNGGVLVVQSLSDDEDARQEQQQQRHYHHEYQQPQQQPQQPHLATVGAPPLHQSFQNSVVIAERTSQELKRESFKRGPFDVGFLTKSEPVEQSRTPTPTPTPLGTPSSAKFPADTPPVADYLKTPTPPAYVPVKQLFIRDLLSHEDDCK